MRNEKLLNTLFTFMHLQHEADVIMCLCLITVKVQVMEVFLLLFYLQLRFLNCQ